MGWSGRICVCANVVASQLKPTRSEFQNQNLHRRVVKRYCQVEKTIQLSLTATAQSPNNKKTTWLELAKRWKSWLDLGDNFSLIKSKPTRTNSSQLGPSGCWPNDTQLELSWKHNQNGQLIRIVESSFYSFFNRLAPLHITFTDREARSTCTQLANSILTTLHAPQDPTRYKWHWFWFRRFLHARMF